LKIGEPLLLLRNHNTHDLMIWFTVEEIHMAGPKYLCNVGCCTCCFLGQTWQGWSNL